MNRGFEVLTTPIKSESDKKSYKVIRLKNGLTALLITDYVPPNDNNNHDTEKKAAVSMSVGVGSFSDPKEVPGLSHFLEHMLSMGSKKYPGENDFESFIQKSGGESNAATASETTMYYFSCHEKHLFKSLDIFAQFFIAPLLNKNAITREREAVESEFQMNAIPSNDSRKEMLKYSFAKPSAKMNFFSWGNLKTLKDYISEERLYEELHKYRERHYSAHRMKLVIQACLPAETLERYVVELFSSIPNNNLPKIDFGEGIFDTPEFNKIYYVKPVTEITKVELTWSLPSLLDKYRSKPLQYITHLLGHEGDGSLQSYLKKRFWANSVMYSSANSQEVFNSFFTLFSVTISLTEEGLKNIFDVIEAVFAYINLIKPEKRIFDELKLVADVGYKFIEEPTATETVTILSDAMHLYPPQDYIVGNFLMYEYDPVSITKCVKHLTPNNVNIIITTKNLPTGLKYDKIEKWIGTEYVGININADVKTKWENAEPHRDFQLPSPNPYLTEDFNILPKIFNISEYPQKIFKTKKCELWYKQDQKFKLPNAHYNCYLINSISIESAKNATLTDILLSILRFNIQEEAYPAKIANLSYKFFTFENGVTFKISGFQEKLPLLVDLIARNIKNMKDHIDERLFTGIKSKFLKNYYNELLDVDTLEDEVRSKLIQNNYWTYLEKYNALLNINYDDMKEYLDKYLRTMYVKALVQGNVTPEIAEQCINKFINTLGFRPFVKQEYPKLTVVQLPLGEKIAVVESFNKTDSNSITSNYYQVGAYDIRDVAILTIILSIIEEPLFDILRTKEQLGYQVTGQLKNTYNIIGFIIAVHSQATKFTTQYLNSRIEEFLKETKKILENISHQDFNDVKEKIIKSKEEPDLQLQTEVDRNWLEIISDNYTFDRIKQEVKTIREIEVDEMRRWWSRVNSFGHKENFRKLSVQIAGHSEHFPENNNVTNEKLSWHVLGNDENNIDNVENFKYTLRIFPRHFSEN